MSEPTSSPAAPTPAEPQRASAQPEHLASASNGYSKEEAPAETQVNESHHSTAASASESMDVDSKPSTAATGPPASAPDENGMVSNGVHGSTGSVSSATANAPVAESTPSASAPASASTAAPSTHPAAPVVPPEPRLPKEVPEYSPHIRIGGEAGGPSELTFAQVKFLQNVIKALKGRIEARPFIAPVDPIAAGVPHYHTIITRPMDLGTVDLKLALTAAMIKGGNKPTEKVKAAPKWGLDIRSDVYLNVDQFTEEVKLTFNNTRVFNGPLHLISLNADVLEGVFDKQMKTFPTSDPIPAGRRTPQSDVGSTSGRLSDARPKREIHPPPPKDIVYDETATQPKRKSRRVHDALTPAEASHWDKFALTELRFCNRVIEELFKPSHSDVAWVFYDLPDRNLDYAPSYYALITNPISLTDIQSKLRGGQYADADEFDADMQLLFRNCFYFNPPGSDVYVMGSKLKNVYDRTFSKRPEPKPFIPDGIDEPSQPEHILLAQALRDQARQLVSLAEECEMRSSTKVLAQARSTLAALGDTTITTTTTADIGRADSPGYAPSTSSTAPKRRKSTTTNATTTTNGDVPKKPAAKRPRKSAPARGSSAGPAEEPKKPPVKRQRKSKAASPGSDEEDVRVVTYEQKEELANKITALPEDRLEGALKIIAEDKPESTAAEEEIELDIDDLTPRTLYKLYRYVVRPKDKKTTHSKPVKNANDGRKRGTGGLKGKTLNETEETERIRRLQAQLQQFEGTAPIAEPAQPVAGHDDLVNSDSSDDESDLSGEDF